MKSQRIDKIKRDATNSTKPTLCSTFAFAPTATDKHILTYLSLTYFAILLVRI
jgi:hypothetical protein